MPRESAFLAGFMDELTKLAAMPVVNIASQQTQSPMSQQPQSSNVISPTAEAGKNLGLGSAAGQPEQPAFPRATVQTQPNGSNPFKPSQKSFPAPKVS